jgi:hypothetical protein
MIAEETPQDFSPTASLGVHMPGDRFGLYAQTSESAALINDIGAGLSPVIVLMIVVYCPHCLLAVNANVGVGIFKPDFSRVSCC